MSGGIQLSSELVQEVIQVLSKHDQQASNDLIVMQYLTAIAGYILAHQTDPGMDKRGLLRELSGFMGQVVDQVESDLRPQPSKEEAFGVWKPGQP